MKAIQVKEFGDSSVLKLAEVPKPTVNANQILIKVKAVGINPIEVIIRAKKFPILPPLPYTPGTDCAGDVVQCGDGVKLFKNGQRVYTFGTVSGSYAEYALANEEDVYALSEDLSYEQGAALGIPYFTACRALFDKGCLKSSDTVLIHGASGAVGLACCQLASKHGAVVIGTAGTPAGMELVKRNGASHVFNHRQDKEYPNTIKNITSNKGVNLVVEMSADINLTNDCEMGAFGARIIIVGSHYTHTFAPVITMGKELDIRGLTLHAASKDRCRAYAQEVENLFRSTEFRPVIGKTYALADARTAHDEIMNSSGAMGKLVIKVD